MDLRARPRLPAQRAGESIDLARALQTQAIALDPQHRRDARRRQRRRRAARIGLLLLLLVAAVVLWRVVPWGQWWQAVVDATQGSD